MENIREKSRHHVPYGTKILTAEGSKVKKGQKVAEWDPFTIPVITEKEGKVELVDLINNVSVRRAGVRLPLREPGQERQDTLRLLKARRPPGLRRNIQGGIIHDKPLRPHQKESRYEHGRVPRLLVLQSRYIFHCYGRGLN